MKKGDRIKIYDENDKVIDAVYDVKLRYCYNVYIKKGDSKRFNHAWYLSESRIVGKKSNCD